MQNNEEFKKLDESLMKELEALRNEPLPPNVTKGFAGEVQAKIRSNQKTAKPWMQWRIPAAALVPVFAVLVLAVSVTLRSVPSFGPVMSSPSAALHIERAGSRAPTLTGAAAPVEIAAAVQTEDVDETMAILAELGELEGDEAADAAAIEEALTDLDVSSSNARFSASA